MWLERWWSTLRLRLRSLVRRRDVERDLDEELRFHVEQQIDENVSRGMTREQARTVALRAMGGVERRKEECRDSRRVYVIENFVRDVRYAVQCLRRSPAFTAAAVISLALGIGSNTAIFSLINTLLLRTLPVTAPERLALVSGGGTPNQLWTYAVWDQIRQQSPSFDSVCAWGAPGPAVLRFNLAQGGEMQPIDGVFASGSYFTTLGVPALLGRTFSEKDDTRGGGPDGPVAVISHDFWQRQFGGTARAVGATLVVNHVPLMIIGVTPPGFFGAEVGRSFDITVPIATEALMRGRHSYLDHRSAYWLNVMVRRKPAQSLEAAAAALRAVQPQVREGARPPRPGPQFLELPFTLTPAAAGRSILRQRYERPLLAIFAVVTLVLLIACANVANLLLARATARTHELTVRLALGAGRWRLAQQLFVESLLLSVVGGALGLLLALLTSRALPPQLSTEASPVFLNLSVDGRVLLFTMLVAFGTTLLFGTAPALRVARMRPIDALKEHGRGPAADRRAGVSGAAVVAQVALTVVLVVAAGLFVRTFARLAHISPGFDADRVLVVNVDASRIQADLRQRLDLYQRLAESAAALPGVASAAASGTTPLSGSVWGGTRIEVPGAPPLSDQESTALVNFVTPGWLATYGTRLIAGRDLEKDDTDKAPLVTLVNEAFVQQFFPGGTALGRTVLQFPDRTTRSVVGVIGDALYRSPREPRVPAMYIPLAQYNWSDTGFSNVSISVRAVSGSPALLAHSVAAGLTEVDRNLAFTFRPLADQVTASLRQERLVATLSSIFGGMSLLLAAVGLYGVTSYTVNRRRSELGIRLALGAAPGGIVRLVVGRVLRLVTLGVLIGVATSLWVSRFVATLLYGLEPRDPATLAGAVIILAATGAAAASVPAWRASRIDPAHVLRDP
jgi:predicted permease